MYLDNCTDCTVYTVSSIKILYCIWVNNYYDFCFLKKPIYHFDDDG